MRLQLQLLPALGPRAPTLGPVPALTGEPGPVCGAVSRSLGLPRPRPRSGGQRRGAGSADLVLALPGQGPQWEGGECA